MQIYNRAALLLRHIPALAFATLPASVLACASCGCTLSSDWDSQGFSVHPGLKLDIRADYLDQDQLRHGSGRISAVDASKLSTSTGAPQEVERDTRNRYLTVGLDYTVDADWGVGVQLPYIDRSHGTLGTGSDGSHPADGAYDSSTAALGDIKLVGRYQGWSPEHNIGLMFGLKLPTGSHTRTGTSTDPAMPGQTAPMDRGLQPGTGTTDAILGLYYFNSLNRDWEYFTQATIQSALNSSDDYKPGLGSNLNLGLRYVAWDNAVPELQLNARHVRHDTGANADQDSTGGSLVYLSPGLVVPAGRQWSVYGFVQVPVYQDVRGVQLAPRYTVSVGARFAFF